MNVPAKKQSDAATIENVLVRGDLKDLTEAQRTEYYLNVCKSLGLNPTTRPFEYLVLNGRLQLYARRDAADQLRKINGISIEVVSRGAEGELYTVHVRAKDRTGRTDEDFGVVPFKEGLAGEFASNAILKCITKAKRRVTLSISGLGFLDETEIPAEPARRPSQTINKKQLDDLIALADRVDADITSYLEYLSDRWEMPIAKVTDIPAGYFDDAMAQLNRKAEAMDKADTKAIAHE